MLSGEDLIITYLVGMSRSTSNYEYFCSDSQTDHIYPVSSSETETGKADNNFINDSFIG